MFDDIDLTPQRIRLKVFDFVQYYETLHTRLEPCPTANAPTESDISFAIKAPMDFVGMDDGSQILFYLDAQPCSRKLPTHGYQIVYSPSSWGQTFQQWAEITVQLVRESILGTGLVCIDLSDLLSVLKAAESRRLNLEVIVYEHPCHVPTVKFGAIQYKSLFATLFGATDLSLWMHSALEDHIRFRNPNLVEFKQGMKFFACEVPFVMLLGEQISENLACPPGQAELSVGGMLRIR